MLPEVVKSRKASIAVTLKRSLPSMFAYVAGQVLASGEAEVAGREACTEEALAFLFARPGIVVTLLIEIRVLVVVWVIQVHSIVLDANLAYRLGLSFDGILSRLRIGTLSRAIMWGLHSGHRLLQGY
jgi:hypothetical protein